MTDTTLTSVHPRSAFPRALPRRPGVTEPARPAEDRLWCEHGWGLSAATVATLVGLILLASAASHLLG